MKVLFVSRYVDPSPVGSNNNVFKQAKYLNNKVEGIDIEILTWPLNDLWSGRSLKKLCPIPPLKTEREGLVYHVFTAPLSWNETTSVIDNRSWEQAISYGLRVLERLKPDIVHLQHRHGLWWLLESAQRMGIPTIYTNHDWGLACLRTVLVKGDGALCDGVVESGKCAACISHRKSSTVGRWNEKVACNIFGRIALRVAKNTPLLGQQLIGRGMVVESALVRSNLNYTRAKRVISQLWWCFTPSRFGAEFFKRLGCAADRISVLPWYHDPVEIKKKPKENRPFTITYIGRVSPEKGVQEFFSALERLDDIDPVIMRIAGAINSEYALALQAKYPCTVGRHRIEWKGWTEIEPLFLSTDAIIIPSQLMDNTPLALIEALAYHVPVIATNVPTMAEWVEEGVTGFLAEYKNIESLSDAIRRAALKIDTIRADRLIFPDILGLEGYMAEVIAVYKMIYRKSSATKQYEVIAN